MKKRARRQAGTGVQMFPFLDALICTMGALLVLLHAFARHGQVEAIRKAEEQVTTSGQASETVDEVKWRIAQLTEARDKTKAQLADERLRLSHIEDHERRLREKFEKLKIAVNELARLENADTSVNQQTLNSLAAASAGRGARVEVAEARRAAKERAVTYSVVPYEGSHSTHRRPIYIECTAEAIVLQPEGIELSRDDFMVLGPGNPLASSLRAMSEYYNANAPPGQAEEPYPLLLVRPDGIEAYRAARAALTSWASDFGYELIGSDWKLAFPTPDARLAEITRQSLSDARARQREYILMASPQMAKNRNRKTFHASSRGGFTAERGSGGGDGPENKWASSRWGRGGGGAPGSGNTPGSGAGAGGGLAGGPGGSASQPGGPNGNGRGGIGAGDGAGGNNPGGDGRYAAGGSPGGDPLGGAGAGRYPQAGGGALGNGQGNGAQGNGPQGGGALGGGAQGGAEGGAQGGPQGSPGVDRYGRPTGSGGGIGEVATNDTRRRPSHFKRSLGRRWRSLRNARQPIRLEQQTRRTRSPVYARVSAIGARPDWSLRGRRWKWHVPRQRHIRRPGGLVNPGVVRNFVLRGPERLVGRVRLRSGERFGLGVEHEHAGWRAGLAVCAAGQASQHGPHARQ